MRCNGNRNLFENPIRTIKNEHNQFEDHHMNKPIRKSLETRNNIHNMLIAENILHLKFHNFFATPLHDFSREDH